MKTFKRNIASLLVATMVLLSTGRAAQASLAPAQSGMEAAIRAQDMQTVQTFIEQKEVSQHLTGLGMSANEVNSRLSNLSDQELHQVASRIDREHPGRDGGGVLVTVLVIGILVLLFVYLLKRV